MIETKCFWCDKAIYGQNKTKDHLFSTFIRSNFPVRRQYLHRLSCRRCNQDRGHVSNIFAVVYMLKNNCWNPSYSKPKNYKRMKDRLFKRVDVARFRDKVKNNLRSEAKAWCLMEIDEVLSWAKNVM